MSSSVIADYISHVESSIAAAQAHRSKLLPFHLEIDGMSSDKNRHLFNNLLSLTTTHQTRYLEVGSWKGSTLCAALFANPIDAVAIDNFSQFHGITFNNSPAAHPAEYFQRNVLETKRLSPVPFTLKAMAEDAFSVDPTSLGLFDVYFYDGEHVGPLQKKAFTHFAPALQSTFIAIVDDAKDEATRQATKDGLAEAGFSIAKDWYLYEETAQTLEGLKSGWWNGVYLAVCTRP